MALQEKIKKLSSDAFQFSGNSLSLIDTHQQNPNKNKSRGRHRFPQAFPFLEPNPNNKTSYIATVEIGSRLFIQFYSFNY